MRRAQQTCCGPQQGRHRVGSHTQVWHSTRPHLGLEDLDQLELPAPLEFKAFQLSKAAVKVEDGVSLLDRLALLL
eukprot:357988-Chlamydomonas_euryale.AAC.4